MHADSLKGNIENLSLHYNDRRSRKVAVCFALFAFATGKQICVTIFMRFDLSYHFLTTDFLYIYRLFIWSYCIDKISSCPEISSSIFKFVCLSNIINALLCCCATLRYSGILTKIWIWSGHACAPMISIFFSLHNFLMICPISALHSLYITFLLYFGANTMWYWRLYLECAVLFISFFLFKTS